MKIRLFQLIILTVALGACVKYPVVPIPTDDQYTIMPDTHPLSDASKGRIEGLYAVSDGSAKFGDQVVLKFNKAGLAIDCSNGDYCCLEAGSLDSVILLQGYWRYAMGTESGLVTMRIKPNEGGSDILAGRIPGKIVIRGAFGDKPGIIDQSMTLQFIRPISEAAKKSKFIILANYGGGRNTDGLPVSENSIEMLNFTQRFGTMGVEIDIHVSADGVPFLYHDDDINIRLCQKGPIQGPIDNYTWEELSAYVRLVHGEQIPSLENALNFILDSTDMKFVWLDLKVSNNAAAKVIPIQMAILARAKQMGRDLQIVYGCPSEEVITDFMSYPGYQDIPSLCELSIDDVHKINAHAWGPRWTEGEQQAGLQEIHNQGRIGITWTLDDMSYIQKYIAEADFDGFLTNYPCLVAYYHYIR